MGKINFWLLGEGVMMTLLLSTFLIVCITESIVIACVLLIGWFGALSIMYIFYRILIKTKEEEPVK